MSVKGICRPRPRRRPRAVRSAAAPRRGVYRGLRSRHAGFTGGWFLGTRRGVRISSLTARDAVAFIPGSAMLLPGAASRSMSGATRRPRKSSDAVGPVRAGRRNVWTQDGGASPSSSTVSASPVRRAHRRGVRRARHHRSRRFPRAHRPRRHLSPTAPRSPSDDCPRHTLRVQAWDVAIKP